MTTISTKASSKKNVTVKKIVIKKTGSKKISVKAKTTEVPNKYKVPVRLWKSFKENGQKMFNDMMDQSLHNQEHMTHPKQSKLPQEQWQTLCWNHACHAAWSTKNLI